MNITEDIDEGDDCIIEISLPDAAGQLEIYVDDELYGTYDAVNGSFAAVISDLEAGEHILVFKYLGDEYYHLFTSVYDEDMGEERLMEFYVTVQASEVLDTQLSGEDIEIKYKEGAAWTVTLTDAYENPISGVNVVFSILDKNYTRKTDSDGIAGLTINLNPGTYDISATFEGNDIYESSSVSAAVTVIKSVPILNASDLVMAAKDGSAWTVTLTYGNGDPIANNNIQIGINNKTYTRKTDANGVASLPINLGVGVYKVNASYAGSAKIESAFVNATITVTNPPAILTANDIEMEYKDGSAWNVTLTDANGNIMPLTIIKVTINGKTYNLKTDANGVASIPINLRAGKYVINATFEGNSLVGKATINSTVNIGVPAVLTASDLVMSYKDGSQYTTTLTDGNGDAIAGALVKFTIKGKTYNRRTDENGVASLPINLAPGTYDISAKFECNGVYRETEVANTITVSRA